MMKSVVIVLLLGLGLLTGAPARAAWDGNPSFELPYTDSWYSFRQVQTGNSSDFALHGSQSLKVATDVVGRYTVIDYPHSTPLPGAVYTFSVYYYVDQPLGLTENLGIGIWWLKLNQNGSAFEYSAINPGSHNGGLGPAGTETVGAWAQVTHTETAPADAEFLELAIEVTGAGSAIYFDRVSVTVSLPVALQRSGEDLVVDFDSSGVLQSTTNLILETWMDVDGGAVTNGPYVIPVTMPSEWFRLRAP